MTRHRIGRMVLAVVAIGAALWLGVIAGGMTVYHHFTR